jgi:hypothetical protein
MHHQNDAFHFMNEVPDQVTALITDALALTGGEYR